MPFGRNDQGIYSKPINRNSFTNAVWGKRSAAYLFPNFTNAVWGKRSAAYLFKRCLRKEKRSLSFSKLSHFKFISYPVNSFYLPVNVHAFNLLKNPLNMHINGTRIAGEVKVPYLA